jgi:transcriptional regulator with XRE-family HTH domain
LQQKRYSPSKTVRAFGDQLEALCKGQSVQKQDVAAKAGIAPSQLAHYLKYGTSVPMMKRIAKALQVDPTCFDVYVAQAAEQAVLDHKELLELLRTVLGTSESRRKTILREVRLSLVACRSIGLGVESARPRVI